MRCELNCGRHVLARRGRRETGDGGRGRRGRRARDIGHTRTILYTRGIRYAASSAYTIVSNALNRLLGRADKLRRTLLRAERV